MFTGNKHTAQTRLNSRRTLASVVLALSVASVPMVSWSQAGEEVKLSSGGICHDVSSRHYERVKNFKPFDTMQDCLNSGGRKPKK